MIKAEDLPPKQIGLYIGATNTFYTIMITQFTKEDHIIGKLRSILTARDITDFHKTDLSGVGDKSKKIAKWKVFNTLKKILVHVK
mgnify:CR=1 FL=1